MSATREPRSGCWPATGEALGSYILIVFSLIAIVFVIHLLRRLSDADTGLILSLTFILAGALGNLVDRLFLRRGDRFSRRLLERLPLAGVQRGGQLHYRRRGAVPLVPHADQGPGPVLSGGVRRLIPAPALGMSRNGLAMEQQVTFGNSRDERLAGVLHLPRGEAVLGVILCHGMESSKESLKHIRLGASLSRAGFAVLRFDFTGAGESTGDFESITCTRQVDDLEAAHDLLKDRGVSRVGVVGSSMGGTTALMYAGAAEGVAALVTLAAPFDPRELIVRDFPPKAIAFWRAQGFIDSNGRRLNTDFLEEAVTIDVAQAVARITCPRAGDPRGCG